jgi:fructose-1,6-bisphosphatase II
MGGEIQARLCPQDDEERAAMQAAGHREDLVLTMDDLVRSDNCFFAATGITDGPLLSGVRVEDRVVLTQSLVMRSRSGTVRRVDATHRIDKMNAALDSN